MSLVDDERKRIVSLSDQKEEFFTAEDGFVYWWPEGHETGCFSSHHLRYLADELDSRNKEWQTQIMGYFADRPSTQPDPLPAPPAP